MDLQKIDIEALRAIEREKGLEFGTVVEAFELALASAYKRSSQTEADEARVSVDRSTGNITVWGQELDDEGAVVREWEEAPRDFGRIVAQTAKQVLMQRLREAEREATYGEYSSREGDVISGQVSVQGRSTYIEVGRTQAFLPVSEMVPNERLDHGAYTRAIVIEVRRQARGSQIICSRRHEGLVVHMFALEVPEIADGTVEVKAIAREPGHRTKVAVSSNNDDVDAVGACVGPEGRRVRTVQSELHNEGLEKIDLVPWDDDPKTFVANALSPAKVDEVFLYEDGSAVLVVPDAVLSLAIGREGQNARLAAKLTGWNIEIKSQSQFEAERKAFEEALEKGLVDEFGNPLSEEGAKAIEEALTASQKKSQDALERADAEPSA